jgi:hypothetical protein
LDWNMILSGDQQENSSATEWHCWNVSILVV